MHAKTSRVGVWYYVYLLLIVMFFLSTTADQPVSPMLCEDPTPQEVDMARYKIIPTGSKRGKPLLVDPDDFCYIVVSFI